MNRQKRRVGRRGAATALVLVVVGVVAFLVAQGWNRPPDATGASSAPASTSPVLTSPIVTSPVLTSASGTTADATGTGPEPVISSGPTSDPATADALRALASLTVLADRPDVPGYQRGCGAGQGCSFGPAWTDDSDAPDGHNGCGTRNDVLQQQLTDVVFAEGSGCVVIAGTLDDPYTGAVIPFSKADAAAVQIDHVYALSRAYDMGAADWTQERRTAFANDTQLELLAVDGAVNQAKGDSGPAEWMPPDPDDACAFVQRYIAIAAAYQLAITAPESDSMRSTLAGCG